VPRDWDAETYDRIADPQYRWGLAVLDGLEARPGETVLDAGCGSGRVTEALLERYADVAVVALDGSASMIEQARRRLARFGDRVRFVVGDLLEPIAAGPVDAVFSTATFHWIVDHDRLFSNLAAVTRPGGRLVAQCGGAGNLAAVARALDDIGAETFDATKEFATAEGTAGRLEGAGYRDVECWLHDEPTPFGSTEELAVFLKTVALGAHVATMTPEAADAFALDVARRLPTPELDYVRLNIRATRASTNSWIAFSLGSIVI
jgi:trans-aconitate 2-methyltransferase